MPQPPERLASAAGRTARRVLLVGWDGADWGVIDPLLAAGRLPNVAKLISEGVRGPLFARPPWLSPVQWTSVVTGKRPHKHGVLGHSEPRKNGNGARAVRPATRTVPAVWNILSKSGLRCHVAGWPVTHPSEQINGVMISDRHAPQLAGTSTSSSTAQTVEPPDAAAELAELYLHARDVDAASLQQIVPLAAEVDQRTDHRLAACAAILAETATLHAAATYVVVQYRPWDFAAVCYRGIEQFSRTFMQFHPPRREEVGEREFELYGGVVARAYEFHDMMLGRLIELAGPGTTVMLVSDHGYQHDHRRPRKSSVGLSPEAVAAAWHRARGLVVMAGPGVRRGDGSKLAGAEVVDVTPSVLSLLGLPRGADMDGRPWTAALENSDGTTASPPDEILTWDEAAESAGRASAIDQPDEDELASAEAVRHLIELGYTDPPDPEARRAAENAARSNAINLARALISARQPARAIEALAGWADEQPPVAAVIDTFAEAHFLAGKFDDARRLVERILERGGDAPLAYLGLGAIELAANKTAAALEHLQTAERQSAGLALPGLHATVGRVYLRMRRWTDARRSFERALEYDGDDAEAFDGLAATCIGEGLHEEAAKHAGKAIAIAPDLARSHFRLGLALLSLGRAREAEAAFHACVAVDPELLGPHRRLAELYAGPLYDPRLQRQHESRVREILLTRRTVGRWDETED